MNPVWECFSQNTFCANCLIWPFLEKRTIASEFERKIKPTPIRYISVLQVMLSIWAWKDPHQIPYNMGSKRIQDGSVWTTEHAWGTSSIFNFTYGYRLTVARIISSINNNTWTWRLPVPSYISYSKQKFSDQNVNYLNDSCSAQERTKVYSTLQCLLFSTSEWSNSFKISLSFSRPRIQNPHKETAVTTFCII
jgi:hypothetical protein